MPNISVKPALDRLKKYSPKWIKHMTLNVYKLPSHFRNLVFDIFWKRPSNIEHLNRTQELFCQWNADRLNISLEQSRKRYIHSWRMISGGHHGAEFGYFCALAQDIFSVFYDDNEFEIFDTYNFHGHLHLLRMLSYEEPEWKSDHPIIQELSCYKTIRDLEKNNLPQYWINSDIPFSQ